MDKSNLDILREGAVIPAMPLALDDNRHFDRVRQSALIKYYLDAGVGGLAVGVHTTQFSIRQHGLYEPLLDLVMTEKKRFLARTGKEVVMVAGVCGETPQALREAETARALGYDAALLSPGGLDGATEEYLLERTRAVAEILPVVGFYLQPAAGGLRLSYEYWRALCEIPNVAAVKCAPFNRYQTLDLMRGVAFSSRASEIGLYTGNDDNIVIDLLTKYRFPVGDKIVEVGFAGGLLGHWSVWTKTAVELLREIKACKGDIPQKLLTRAVEVTDCNGVFFDARNDYKGGIPGVEEILRRQGLFKNCRCLDPNETLSPGQSDEIDRVYRMYPHLNDDDFVRANLEKWLSEE
ncbi:MAG: dihydrodipicolinate synthase family protein [Defluviitaleaceae bacterium]|nr:dihydrodipicolinate synthase family protein [Defluviitaleaceae bacterium]